jgi:hypothetical protein
MNTETSGFSAELGQFTGSEHWYLHELTGVLYTDGAKYLAENAGAYWLLDEISIAQRFEEGLKDEFQVWTLSVRPDSTATLTCDDGNGTILFTKELAYTDFPLPTITLYCSEGTIYLPSEH